MIDVNIQMEAEVFAYGRYGGEFSIPQDVPVEVDYSDYLFDGETASFEEFVFNEE